MDQLNELHRHNSTDKLQSLGYQLYREGKYDEALEAYNAILQSSPETSSKLLDQRAATYEKLLDYKSALKDARQMIKQDHDRVNGYLRAGQILVKMEKLDVALQIYKRGLEHCRGTNDQTLYEVLRKASSKLAVSQGPVAAFDPIEVLPPELFQMMFSDYLPFSDLCHTDGFSKCLNVSKAWRDHLTSNYRFWIDLDLSDAGKYVSTKAFNAYTKHARGRLRNVTLKRITIQGNNSLETLAKKNKDMLSLSLIGGGTLSDSLLNSVHRTPNLKKLTLDNKVSIAQPVARQICRSCPSLVEIYFGHVDLVQTPDLDGVPMDLNNLESLKVVLEPVYMRIPYDVRNPVDLVHVLGGNAPNLKHLDVALVRPGSIILAEYFAFMSQLQSLALTNMRLLFAQCNDQLPFTRRLRYLKLIDTVHGLIVEESTIDKLWFKQSFPCLLSLIVSDHRMHRHFIGRLLDPEGGLGGLFKTPESSFYLETLDINASSFAVMSELQDCILVLPQLQNLRQLRMSYATAFTDKEAAFVASTMENLVSIEMSHCKITGIGVKSLITGLPHLKLLKLEACDTISADAIEWAREQGVRVLHTLEVMPKKRKH